MKCGLGSELITGDACKLCPRGSYRDAANQTNCVSCPVTGGVTTTTYILGAKSSSSCKGIDVVYFHLHNYYDIKRISAS